MSSIKSKKRQIPGDAGSLSTPRRSASSYVRWDNGGGVHGTLSGRHADVQATGSRRSLPNEVRLSLSVWQKYQTLTKSAILGPRRSRRITRFMEGVLARM
jgi:hypothetical protein